jgi:hypothetical protein
MPSFQFAGGTDWMGNQYTDPNAMMAQTGAMALALNQQRQGMMGQGQFGSLNPQMAYNQGMEMLQQGWQNPFAQQPQDPGGNIRDLIQGPQPGKPEPTSPYPASWGEPPARQTRDNVALPGGGYGSSTMRNWILANMNGQAQPAQDPGGNRSLQGPNGEPPESGHWLSTADLNGPGGGPSVSNWIPRQPQALPDPGQQIRELLPPTGGPARRFDEPYPQPVAPPTAEQFRQQQTEIKQKEAVNDLYRRANLQPGASTDELMLGLINNSQGGTLVRPEALAGLPADIRGAVSQYQDLAGMAQGLDRSTAPDHQQRLRDIGAAMEQMKSRMTERAQASQALQRDYGMSPADAAAWVNREMPMQDQAATMRGLEQKQTAYLDQARSASLDRRAKQEMEAAKPKAPSATDQWSQIRATTNTQTKPLSPAHQRVYEAMVAEQWKSRGRDDSWAASGSPLANMARARNAKTGQGITGMEPRKR